MKRVVLMIMFCLALSMVSTGQVKYDESQMRIFTGKGDPATVESILTAAGGNDAIFLGELHDDAVGHAFQAEIFRRIVAEHLGKRPIALSMEMFERDVQTVVDEYLAGLITEDHFLRSSRPWPSYRWDYKPLVELAKEKRVPVLAANAPRRYVNMVSRNGRPALNGLSKQAREWLPPLPFPEPSAAYSAKFKALMGPSAEARMGLDNILQSQSLWDAAMAHTVASFLKKNKNALVVHLNGGFHTESRLGTIDHLTKYRSKARAVVVTIRYENDFRRFDPAKHTGLGDFVVLTDGSQPRSKRS